MAKQVKSPRSTVRRSRERASYDPQVVNEILDRHRICHVGLVEGGLPVVIPTMYVRVGGELLLHGSHISRLIRESSSGMALCVSIMSVSGLVLARSAFEHSVNYESVVVFGRGRLLGDDEKLSALEHFTEAIVPGRWSELRPPTKAELRSTSVVGVAIEEVSAKIRTGPPGDGDTADAEPHVWAGELTFSVGLGAVRSAPECATDLMPTESVLALSSALRDGRAARY
jgi:nitroimidazol reductase NimA-like FMN-containing flavoprotein (pyridoxamine 5'-phosphate oxidase superfamily)